MTTLMGDGRWLGRSSNPGLQSRWARAEKGTVTSSRKKGRYEVGTESTGIGYGEEVYEEMMLHPSLRPENQAPQKGN